MGKTRADYVPHASSDTSVQITNASKLKVRDTKMASQQYQNYSGYPGGQRIETLRSLSARKGYGAAIRLAVQRMLPNNSLRTGRLKRLHISE
jgi:large subunit ribosomal protein L13